MKKNIILIILIFQINIIEGQEKKTQWDEIEISDMSALLYKQKTASTASTGTCSIIEHNAKFYLVTAAHVAKPMDSLSQIIFRIENDKPYKVDLKRISATSGINWVFHKEADMAILELKIPNEKFLKNRIENNSFPSSQINNGKNLPSRDSDITFFGYPVIDLDLTHFSSLSFNSKICSGLLTQRRGDNKKKSTFFYLNIPSIQGCSGSGVYYSVKRSMFHGGKKTIFLGVMHGTYSDNTGGKLAAITPSYYLFDILK
ncbi:trypsin-like peptidase domain-containing protein [Algibacter amylolyticus]|uniref:Trypsin-like peptidase domain-containing protein n=1 Tax=Algibacter amylolyticus TaxID=1608400 RepID=A0A5M7BEX3_9FLAO|nr:trypsin-like peptidase domain-containing protein [Algibacter amylolyticus]KAA5825725.1 trypsin-like peptidase domain-containing protein [Algibacter amylolyticus]MBB5268041.1 hypothetical protein [Algibacter amylolyticus]TSJ80023.1 trypsin-like peptidase domain-containing protein [Algibacter amylolyticus]